MEVKDRRHYFLWSRSISLETATIIRHGLGEQDGQLVSAKARERGSACVSFDQRSSSTYNCTSHHQHAHPVQHPLPLSRSPSVTTPPAVLHLSLRGPRPSRAGGPDLAEIDALLEQR